MPLSSPKRSVLDRFLRIDRTSSPSERSRSSILLGGVLSTGLLVGGLTLVAAAQPPEAVPAPDAPTPEALAQVAPEAGAAVDDAAPIAERTPEDVARRAQVLARVGEVSITVGTVEDAINEQSPFVRVRYRDPAQMRSFAESLIRFELLARAAERAEMGEDAEIRRLVKQQSIQQLIRRQFDERITITSIPEADIRAYYDTHPEEFTRAEMRRAAHIQVETAEEASRLITSLAEADSREFRRLAREHSVDPETRLRGGDLRYFNAEGGARNTRDPRIHEGLAAAAFGLEEVGDLVSEPIAVGERFSIVRLTGLRPAEHHAFERASTTIRAQLWRQRRQQAVEDFVRGLRERLGVERHPELVTQITLDEPSREDQDAESDEGPSH